MYVAEKNLKKLVYLIVDGLSLVGHDSSNLEELSRGLGVSLVGGVWEENT